MRSLLSYLCLFALLLQLLPVSAFAATNTLVITKDNVTTQIGTLSATTENGNSVELPVYLAQLDADTYDAFQFNLNNWVGSTKLYDTGTAYYTIPSFSSTLVFGTPCEKASEKYNAGVEVYGSVKDKIVVTDPTFSENERHSYVGYFWIQNTAVVSFGASAFIIIEWTDGEIAVADKGELEASIANGDRIIEARNYYTENDRYNGKTTSTDGFWADFRAELTSAKAVHANESVMQEAVDAATESLNAAIANLIPSDKVNPTLLYETVQDAERRYPDSTLGDYTDHSASAFRSALSDARTTLASLYDDAGNPMPVNVSSYQNTVDQAAAALTSAMSGMVARSAITALEPRVRSIPVLYAQTEGLKEADYTADSWTAFQAAREAAYQSYQKYGSDLEGRTSAERKELSDGYQALYEAYYYGLKNSAATVIVRVRTADSLAIKESGYAQWQHQSASAALTGDQTVGALLDQLGISLSSDTDKRTLAVFVNGLLVCSLEANNLESPIHNDSWTNQKFRDIVLHEDDDVVLARLPLGDSMYYINPGDAPLKFTKDFYALAEAEGTDHTPDETGVLMVTEGEDFTLHVTKTAAASDSYTGRATAFAGAKVYASPDGAEGDGPNAAPAPTMDTGFATDRNGEVTLRLYGTGWQHVYIVDPSEDQCSILDTGEVSGELSFPTLTVGAGLWVYVTPAEDAALAAGKREFADQLDAAYQALDQTMFTEEQLNAIDAAYAQAKTAIPAAGTLKAAKEAYDAAIAVFDAQLADAGAANDKALSQFRDILSYLPAAGENLYQSDATLFRSLMQVYDGMTGYQRGLLTGAELSRYNAMREAYGADGSALPETVKTKVTVRVVGNAAGGKLWDATVYAYPYAFNDITQTVIGANTGGTVNYAGAFIHTYEVDPRTGFQIDLYAPIARDESGAYQTHFFGGRTMFTPDDTYEITSITVDGADIDYFVLKTIAETKESSTDVTWTTSDGVTKCRAFTAAVRLKCLPEGEDVTITIAVRGKDDEATLDERRADALAALKAAYNGYSKADYTTEAWTELTRAYNDGVSKVNAAADADEIDRAKTAALDAMAAVQPGRGTGGDTVGELGTVYVTVENNAWTGAKDGKEPPAGMTGVFVEEAVALNKDTTMMSAVLSALAKNGYTWTGTGGTSTTGDDITYIASITSKDGGTLQEKFPSGGAGWMGTLNDWFTSEGFGSYRASAVSRNYRLVDGDHIAIQFTLNLGVDIDSVWGDTDTSLRSLTVTGGKAIAFDSETLNYVLVTNGSAISVAPTASNKNYQVRTYLNGKSGDDWYRSGETIPAQSGDIIYVGVGDRSWPSMNDKTAGTWYAIYVIDSDAASGASGTVTDVIASLPPASKLTLDDAGDVAFAKELYDSLSETEQAKVSNVSRLNSAVEAIKDMQAAAKVEDLLSSVPTLTDSNMDEVREKAQAAMDAYNSLTEAQKGYITVALVNRCKTTLELIEAGDLNQAKQKAIESLDASVKDEGDYTAENWAKVQTALTDGKAAINAASTVAEVSDALTDARAAIEAIPTIAGTDQAKVTAAVAAINGKTWTVAQTTANNTTDVRSWLTAQLGELAPDVTCTLPELNVTQAVAGTKARPAGTNGTFEAKITLTSGTVSQDVTVTGTITATAYAEDGAGYSDILKSVLSYLQGQVPRPNVGSTNGEWAVLAQARAGTLSDNVKLFYLENLKTYVDDCDGKLDNTSQQVKHTEYERVVLALTSLGVDASSFNTGKKTYDLVAPLLDKSNGAYEYLVSEQGNNGTIFALLALDSGGYLNNAQGNAARANWIDTMIEKQMDDGSWPISNSDQMGDDSDYAVSSDIDTTAMAIQALAPYYRSQSKFDALGAESTYAQLKRTVDDALTWLSKRQNQSGGFGSSEASAQVVVALSALGRDAATDADFTKNGTSVLGDLLGYYVKETGGFRHLTDSDTNQMATEQAAYALVAYDRYKKNQNTLYDMTDALSGPSGTTHTITATAGAGGVISPEGTVSVKHGGSQTFTITPDDGYEIKDILVDGQSVWISYSLRSFSLDNTLLDPFETFAPSAEHHHSTIYVEEVEATCAEPGYVAYWYCEDCGEKFLDEDGTEPLTDGEIPVDPSNHVDEEIVLGRREATCIEGGYTGDTLCGGCGEVLRDGEDTEPAEHSYGEHWYADESGHWQVCTVCGVSSYVYAHTLEDGPSDAEEAAEATEDAADSDEPSAEEPGDTGDAPVTCLDCGYVPGSEADKAEPEPIEEPCEHAHNEWAHSSGLHWQVCEDCGLEDRDSLEAHDWALDEDRSDGTVSVYTCAECGAKRTVTEAHPAIEASHAIAAYSVSLLAEEAEPYSYTFTNVTENHTIRATFRKVNASAVISQPVETSGSTATATIPESAVDTALQAVNETGGDTITIAPAEVPDSVDTVAVDLAKADAARIAADGVNLVVKTGVGNVEIPSGTLQEIVSRATGDSIRILIEERTVKSVQSQVDETLSANCSVAEVTVSSNGRPITSFGGTRLTVYLPVNDTFAVGKSYRVIVLHSDGSREELSGVCRSDNSGQNYVGVTVTKLSTFIVLAETKSEYTITATCNNGGTIDPEGSVKVKRGESQRFWIEAEKGYEIDYVLVDGKEIELDEEHMQFMSYTFREVTEDHSIRVRFKRGIQLPDFGEVIGEVYISIENNTFRGGDFTGTILEGWYDLCEYDTMMTCILKALTLEGYTWEGTGGSSRDDYDITYLAHIVKGSRSLGEFDGERGSGWMGTLNDWFVNEGFQSFRVGGKGSYALEDGDIINVMYTQNLGVDIGGGWGDPDTSLLDLDISGGKLTPKFDGDVLEYTLTISGSRRSITVTPTAANKNYMVKTFLNRYNSDAAYYKRTQSITVEPGDTLYIGVGDPSWPSLNNQGAEAIRYSGTIYVIKVVNSDLQSRIDALPDADEITYENYKRYIALVEAIREDYDELSSQEQKEIDAAKLFEVEERIAYFRAVDDVKDLLNAIPGEKGLIAADAQKILAKVNAAKQAFDRLDDEQKSYFTEDDVAKHNAAVEWLESLGYQTGGKIILTPAIRLPFTDVEGHWAYDAIVYAYTNGLMNGMTPTTFEPDGTLNRAMLVTILYRLEGEPATTAVNPFTDVLPGAWYTDAVTWASAAGIVNGMSPTTFEPMANITCEQMATMLLRYAKYKKYDVSATVSLDAYTDASKVSDWAFRAMQWANAEGLITGRTPTTLVPDGTATRAETATILMRFMEKFVK